MRPPEEARAELVRPADALDEQLDDDLRVLRRDPVGLRIVVA